MLRNVRLVGIGAAVACGWWLIACGTGGSPGGADAERTSSSGGAGASSGGDTGGPGLANSSGGEGGSDGLGSGSGVGSSGASGADSGGTGASSSSGGARDGAGAGLASDSGASEGGEVDTGPRDASDAAAGFVHPGILHSRGDLDRIRSMVAAGTQPYLAGYNVFQADPQSSSTYVMQGPFAQTGRNPDVNKTQTESDANAAYQNAVMWYITGDRAHADKAIQILNGWSSALTTISGNDAILAASLDGFKFVNAAEIIRYTNAAWAAADIAKAESMFKNVFYPVIQNFATFANGNWSTGSIKTMMGIGVFIDDRPTFSKAVDWYNGGTDNGSLTHYIINATGQCQESGRDQQHAQLGIGHLAEASEIGWHQGLDMYGAVDNRVLAGFEYTASYNLGNTVLFQAYTDTTGKYPQTMISATSRGQLRPIYEMVYNHYQNRRGVSCPYTQQAAQTLRPEGAQPYADHPGFGTLLFTKPAGSP